MLSEVVPVLIVVVFWVILFVVAFWFTGRALHAPIPTEDLENHDETVQPDHSVSSQESAGATVDQTRPMNPVH